MVSMDWTRTPVTSEMTVSSGSLIFPLRAAAHPSHCGYVIVESKSFVVL